jgi:hypothetical protein
MTDRESIKSALTKKMLHEKFVLKRAKERVISALKLQCNHKINIKLK